MNRRKNRIGLLGSYLVLIQLLVGCAKDLDTSISPLVKDNGVEVMVTNIGKEEYMVEQPKLSIHDKSEDSNIKIRTDKAQKVDMFGGAITHSTAHLLLEDDTKNTLHEVLEDMFTSKGANFNSIRIPIGSSDFHSEEHFFTCCDKKGPIDDLLKYFNLDHDNEIIEVIKEIKKINPDLKIIATPWSAPSWMKQDSRTSSADPYGYALKGGTLRPSYYDVYAQYLSKFVDEYEELGIQIDYLILDNEPNIENADYPSMKMSPECAIQVLKDLENYLYDDVKVMAYDHNAEPSMYPYLETLFNDDYYDFEVKDVALHAYGSETLNSALPKLKELYPNKTFYLTEITDSKYGGKDFYNDLRWAFINTSVLPYSNGLSGTVYWNLLLNSNGGPCMGQYGNCLGVGTLDKKEDGTYEYIRSAAYYAMAHVSKKLNISNSNQAYALPIDINIDSIKASAFINEDNLVEIVMLNTNNQDEILKVEVDDYGMDGVIPSHSVVTYSFHI